MMVVLASSYLIAFAARTVLSFFLKTPDVSALRGDASRLFYFVYPIYGAVLLAAFLLAAYIIARKIGLWQAGRLEAETPKITKGYQIALACVCYSVVAAFLLIRATYDLVNWYLSAALAGLFGTIDPLHVLENGVTTRPGEAFAYTELFAKDLLWYNVAFLILIPLMAYFVLWHGRTRGERAALERRRARRMELGILD